MAVDFAEKIRGEAGLIQYFPELRFDTAFEVLSPVSREYNCVAWAMQCDDRWVSWECNDRCWWPEGVVHSAAKQSLIDAFKAVGFEETEGYCMEDGYDKVVLYGIGNRWTHAARLIDEHTEHSKFGDGWDAKHGHDKFEDTIYGEPYAIMRRRKDVKTPLLQYKSKIIVLPVFRQGVKLQ